MSGVKPSVKDKTSAHCCLLGCKHPVMLIAYDVTTDSSREVRDISCPGGFDDNSIGCKLEFLPSQISGWKRGYPSIYSS